MSLPKTMRVQIRDKLWSQADEMGWSGCQMLIAPANMSYGHETHLVGGLIGHFMDPRRVRVYIKDLLIKPYERYRILQTGQAVLHLLSIDQEPVAEEFIKPHGRRLEDGRIICWGKSRDWKLILMAAFERAYLRRGNRAFGVALLETGKTFEDMSRDLCGRRLGALILNRFTGFPKGAT